MENSVLSDAAGVQKNISKMYEDYAKSIGKSTDALTQSEKAQAVYNGIMDEAAMFTGTAEEMASGYQGQQAQLNATNLELSRTIGQSMIPALTQYSSLQLNITKGLTEFISNHESATSGIITFTTTVLAMVVGLTAAKKAYTSYKIAATAADMTTKAFTASLLANPITLIAVGIASIVAAYSMYCTKAQETAEAQEKLNEITERYNQIKEGTYLYTNNSTDQLEAENEAINKQLECLSKKAELEEKEKQLAATANQSVFTEGFNFNEVMRADEELGKVRKELRNLNKEYEESVKTNGKFGDSIDELNNKLQINKKGIEEADAIKKISKGLDVDIVRSQQKEAAQLKVNNSTMQQYLDIVKRGKTSTSQYQEAVKVLSQTYPEAANAEGIIIDQAQNLINAEALKADTAWKSSQDTINSYIDVLNAAVNSEAVQKQVAQNIGISVDELNMRLQSTLALYNAMAKMEATDVPNITPVSVSAPKLSSGSSSRTYENKALDNYKKQIEHKKTLDKISLKEEISMYETALRKYAKTADEKNEIREKIYELNKELAQKEKELLEQQTEDYETYIQRQKNTRGAAYDITEQTADYNKIIQMHKKYLNQIMKDERLSLDERKEIYREELSIIRDYEQQKRDLRVEQIDNTVTQLTNAITKQLEELQEKDKEYIDKQIENIEKLKETRINAINAEYDAKIEAIEKELQALDKAEQQKSRDEEDSEYKKKKLRLQQLIDFEHDATTKANYQKELDKLVAEYKKTLEERALEDKKEILEEQKELLKQEQDEKVNLIEEETDKKKEQYENQLNNLEKYYEEQISMAQETAEKMLLNVEDNQNQILKLLKSYGDKYEITGQSLGEKLAQGINDGITNKIQNMIQKIQDTIDRNLESKIKEWTSGMYRYEAGSNKPQTQTINVYQTNNIEQNPEMPSETYRKLRNIDEQLASSLAGM